MELKEYLQKNRIKYTETDNNLSVGGSLDLRGTQITTLPDNLSVGGSLYLEGTQITTLPDNLKNQVTIKFDNKCKWTIYIERKEIKIGCEKHGVTFWKDFFKNKKSFETDPDSHDYDLIKKDFENALELQKKIFK